VTAPKPKSLFRRLERVMVGLVMTVMAFVLERIVMRSIRREGRAPKRAADATPITTKGDSVDLDAQ
jgi:hypothetical protein